jgi:methionyl-tRNA formyltransferase
LRTVYLGTSEFAASVLRTLAAGPHRPALVVTPPDRPRGRGRRPGPPPAAIAATELGIAVERTADVNGEATRGRIEAAGPGLIVVCAFGQIVREPLLSAGEILNVHPSLLPRWRGAAPVERAIMAGDETTGVCIMRLTAGLDSGPVAMRREVPIGSGDDYGSLAATLATTGGELLGAALDRRAAGPLDYAEQAADGVTYAEKIERGERRIDPAADAESVGRTIRALTPHIGAFAELGDGARLGLRDPIVLAAGPPPGRFELAAGELLLGCGSGALRIASVQPAGGRWMDAADYLRGHGPPAAVAPPAR